MAGKKKTDKQYYRTMRNRNEYDGDFDGCTTESSRVVGSVLSEECVTQSQTQNDHSVNCPWRDGVDGRDLF